MTTLGGAPYFVVTEPIWDTGPEMMGHLVMLLRVDSDFLAASQQGGTDNQAIVAITEPEGKNFSLPVIRHVSMRARMLSCYRLST